MEQNWQRKRVLILGAARQGLALARFLSQKGARVVLNDKRQAQDLQQSIEAMLPYGVEWQLGRHDFSLLDSTDLLCLSGGVSADMPLALEARRRGIPLSNDTRIFLEIVPARVTGITGSAGKTTTTSLVGKMAEMAAQPPQKAWVGGNIGLPLIDHVDEINQNDLVVLELSSFQLELVTSSPHISAILNITPNHLDRHGTLENYTAAKAHILAYQVQDDIAVLGRDDPGAWALRDHVKGRLFSFGFSKLDKELDGAYCENDLISIQRDGKSTPIMPVKSIRLRGQHNVQNVLAACCIADTMGISPDVMKSVVEDFNGIPHRLEFVREWHGVRWINDSIATAPERTTAAIHSFDEPIVLLLGGRDKNLPWEELATLVHQRVKHLVIFGEALEKIKTAIGLPQKGETLVSIQTCGGLQDAVTAASRVAEAGQVVLLSPGGTSYDEFKDFEERGERYRLWVNNLS